MEIKLSLKPRDYQLEAAKWALEKGNAVVCLPTGSGKTLVAAVWIKELLEQGKARKVVVLEPTRILVEQVARYLSSVLGLDVRAVHGAKPKSKREEIWRESIVVVTTPETALSDVDRIIESGFDAVVVDECHHTTGKDAYAEFMRRTMGVFKYRLGLSAYIPRSRAKEIEEFIGEIRIWTWSDPRISMYVPQWIGEVYEAELNSFEAEVLRRLEEIRNRLSGRDRGLVQMAIRWFVRDGALALIETLERSKRLKELLGDIEPLLRDPRVRPLHKLEALMRALSDHESFCKAIVFVDRVIVAKSIANELRDLGSVAVCGKSHADVDARTLLEIAKAPSTRLIVSTSAGEEGLDLPEGDLLVIWSNVASPLRFIQRHGRILRATGRKGPPKFVIYIITPDTVDMDSFVDSIALAKKVGVDIPIDEDVLESLWRRTARSRILSLIEDVPMPIEWIHEVTGIPTDILKSDLTKLCKHGDVVYIYTHLGKVYIASSSLNVLYEHFPEYLDPSDEYEGKAVPYTDRGRERGVSGNYSRILLKLKEVLQRYKCFTKLYISLQIPLPGGAYRLVNLVYSFLIDSEAKLELVLRNAFSVHRLYSSLNSLGIT